MRLEFGNPDHIAMRKKYEGKMTLNDVVRKLNNKIKCPECGKMRPILEHIVEHDIENKQIMIGFCPHADCPDHPDHREHDMMEHWSGWINYDGKPVY